MLSIDVWFVRMKFLAVHITNQKLSFDIFMVGNFLNIFMEHNIYLISFILKWDKTILYSFGIIFGDNFDPPIQCIVGYCYKYLIMTGFVIQGHIYFFKVKNINY